MKYQNFIRKSLSFSIVLFALLSCHKDEETLKLVYPNKVNYESFIIANHFNYFNENDSIVKVVTVNSGINAAEAFTLGDAQVAAMGDGPTVMLMSQNKDFVIITRYAQGNKIHRLITNNRIKTPEDLLGTEVSQEFKLNLKGVNSCIFLFSPYL